MRRFIRSNELAPAVVELCDVAEEDLRALYSAAELMLFPSLAGRLRLAGLWRSTRVRLSGGYIEP